MADAPQAGAGSMPAERDPEEPFWQTPNSGSAGTEGTTRMDRLSRRLARVNETAERVAAAAAEGTHSDASSDAGLPSDNPSAVEAAPAPEAAIPRWKAISMGFGIATEISGGTKQLRADQADFVASVTAVGGQFLTDLVAELNESVAATQSEVLAANVPLASYGRVKDALDRVRSALHIRLTYDLPHERARALLLVACAQRVPEPCPTPYMQQSL